MTDIYSKSKRSDIMSQISGKDTKPEVLVRKYLFSKGFRFRRNDPRYPGKPDIILPKYKTAIFIHGCFWHGHECKTGKLPETRKEFWMKKICDNKTRDKKNKSELEADGWTVLTVWDCEINSIIKRERRLNLLLDEIDI